MAYLLRVLVEGDQVKSALLGRRANLRTAFDKTPILCTADSQSCCRCCGTGTVAPPATHSLLPLLPLDRDQGIVAFRYMQSQEMLIGKDLATVPDRAYMSVVRVVVGLERIGGREGSGRVCAQRRKSAHVGLPYILECSRATVFVACQVDPLQLL